ncbi:auxilin-like clathrin-binding protein required for normal clathrin function [Coemansia sp. RSA 487]|nr:auxilin-like clathrin-binding protein required for normal clathrin function [Coemansia sp. RSA 487]
MTTAARPTFDPAKGKAENELTYMTSAKDLPSHTKLKTRKPGQGSEEYTVGELKRELQEAERLHFEAKRSKNGEGGSLPDAETQTRLDDAKSKYIEMAQMLDAESDASSNEDEGSHVSSDEDANSAQSNSDDDGGDDGSSSDEDSEDETAMLMRELEKIKRERAEEKEREEKEELERRLQEEKNGGSSSSLLGGNPLLAKKAFSVKRRWDDDVHNQQQHGSGGLAASMLGGRGGASKTPNYSPSLGSVSNAFNSAHSSSGASLSNVQQQKSVKGDDPFGELVSFSSGSTSSSQKAQAKMTLRERQQVLETQSNLGSVSKSSGAIRTDLWNFDALEQASNSSRSNTGTPMQQRPPGSIGNTASPRDLDTLVSGSAQAEASSNDIMSGLDLLSDSPITSTSPSASPFRDSRTGATAQKSSGLSKDPFNLNVEDGSSDDDGITDFHKASQPPESALSDSFADRDYEISQIAGYGFSVEQARTALEIAGSVRAAVQLLREQQATESHLKNQKTSRPARHKSTAKYRDDFDGQNMSSDNSDTGGYHYDDPRRRADGSGTTRPTGKDQPSGSADRGGTDAFMSTASEIGTSVWKQANSWFAMGKKKIIEIQETVMEQTNKPEMSMGFGGRRDGKQDAYVPSAQRYRDYDSSSSDDEAAYIASNRRGIRAIEKVKQSLAANAGSGSSYKSPSSSANGSLAQNESILDVDAEVSNISTTPVLGQKQFISQSSSGLHSGAPPKPPRTAPQRSSPKAAAVNVPAVSDVVLQQANVAKVSANEKFKLGQFGDAIAGYTQAISYISQSSERHPVLIVLYNNRALAYTRNGEAKNALSDCSKSIGLCDIYQANGVIEAGAAGRVDVAEQRTKSLNRRAEAHESEEKYRQALDDWKKLREAARDTGMRQQASRGIQRCENALGIGKPSIPKSSVSSTRSPSTPASSTNQEDDISSVFAAISLNTVKNSGGITILNRDTENSAAVAEMRKKEQEKQIEDDQKLALTDEIDAELKQWKDGKQHNLRALLCSLHTLLPDFKPIGMHEILESNKVKRAYMRAIAKLHPDKLNKGMDVRTKMVSSSVFSSLNEAWDVFKAQEGVS